jgi:uncharacterized protein YodC (DUF2158 family)
LIGRFTVDFLDRDRSVIDCDYFSGLQTRGCTMTFQPGDVVFLKSGGQSMTVAAITDENVECIWLGEEGDLFRQPIPAVALTSAGDVSDEQE